MFMKALTKPKRFDNLSVLVIKKFNMFEQQLMRDIVREAVHQDLRDEDTIKKLVKKMDTKKSLSKMYVDLIVKAVIDVNK